MEQPALDEIKVVARNLVINHAAILSKAAKEESDSKPPVKRASEIDTKKDWREWLDPVPWNIKIDLNPRNPFLDKFSVVSLGDQVLSNFQKHLFGAGGKGFFVLMPELDIGENLWHFHGFGYIISDKRTRDLLENGSKWFRFETMEHFYSGKCWIPKNKFDKAGNVSSCVVPRPTTEISRVNMDLEHNGYRGYAMKNWDINQKAELICVNGKQP